MGWGGDLESKRSSSGKKEDEKGENKGNQRSGRDKGRNRRRGERDLTEVERWLVKGQL